MFHYFENITMKKRVERERDDRNVEMDQNVEVARSGVVSFR